MRVDLTVLIRGVLATLIAVLTSWLTMSSPVTASPNDALSGAIWTYTAPAPAIAPVDDEYERGPPTIADARTAAYDGVDCESRDDSARAETPATGALTADVDAADFAEARDLSPTAENLRRPGRELVSGSSERVAAKSVSEIRAGIYATTADLAADDCCRRRLGDSVRGCSRGHRCTSGPRGCCHVGQ